MNNQLLAITGNPGSGKTSFALKTTFELYRKIRKYNKSVLYVSFDQYSPGLTLVQGQNTRCSLSDLLNLQTVTEETVLLNTVMLSDNMGFIGFRPNDSTLPVTAGTIKRLKALLDKLRKMFDFIIADCNSARSADLISDTVFEEADSIAMLLSGSIRGVNYLTAQLNRFYKYKAKTFKILSDCQPFYPVNEVLHITNALAVLMHVRELEQQYICAELHNTMQSPQGIKYNAEVNKLIELIFFNSTSTKGKLA